MKLPLLMLASCAVAFSQTQEPKKTEVTVIRGKVMGHATVSPALQQEIEVRYGKKAAPDPKSKGPNAFVGKHGFAYVSPQAEAKDKKNR